MLRAFLLFISITLALFAADQVEFYAKKLYNENTKVVAEGDVLVIYQDSYITADKATYDKNSTELELFGNVVVLKGSEYQLLGEHVKFNMQDKNREISPFYMLEKNTKLWISAQKTSTCEDTFDIKKGIVSGCNPDDPMWEIYFSSSDYNETTKWINLYNARFHIGGIPVLYLPYFGYSMDKTRRSGLLIPSFGLSSAEGAYYEQPMYMVMGDEADIELRPQTRSLRGRGLYGTLRFADSYHSKGSLTLGYFKEKESYFKKNNLQNDSHYGFNFNYENSKVLKNWFGLDLEGQSGLYSDIKWMNDIDYINLSTNDIIDSVTSKQVYSRVNLFYNEEDNYYGAYMKYYLDLDPKNIAKRDATIQKLPIIQYHHYLNTFMKQHLYYTFNMQATNYARREGKKGEEVDFDLPIALQTSLFDEYLNVAYKAKLYGRMIGFRGEEDPSVNREIYKNGFYGSFSHEVSAGTSLTKGYEENAHTMGLSASYTQFVTDRKSGYYKNVENNCSSGGFNDLECEFYTLNSVADNVNLQFTQYIMNAKGREIIYHRLSQPVITKGTDQQKKGLGEFENELRWSITKEISIYDDTFYNFERSEWVKTLNTFRYKDKSFNLGFSYLYENKAFKNKKEPYTNYLTFDGAYRYDQHYKYFTKVAFDVENSIKKYAEVGFLYSKRCWDFGMRYVENNRPVLTQGGETRSVYDKYVYFTIIMKPLGGSEVNYRMTDTLKSF